MRLLSLVGLTLAAYADTGGLTALPFPKGTEILRPSSSNIITNGTFNGSSNWTYGAGHVYDSTVTRTADGTGSIRLNNIAALTTTQQQISASAAGANRVYQLRVWLKASADPGPDAQFRVYLLARNTVYRCGGFVDLHGLGSTWKEYASELGGSCFIWFHTDIHLSQSVTIQLSAQNIPAGVNVWVDDVQILPIVRPLAIFPTYPNYRGMLWPDQGTTIRWNAVAEAPPTYSLSALRVKVQVVRASDNVVLSTLTQQPLIAPRTSGVWTRYSVNPMSYDASSLPDGAYYLRGTLRRTSDDGVVYQYPDYKIVKEQPSVQRNNWKVWADKYNRVIINGRPTFLWGTFIRLTAGRNLFAPGANAGGTDTNSYRALANGCNEAAQSAPCSSSHTPTTSWNRSFGLTGSTLIKQMADLGMNVALPYAAFDAYRIGFNTPFSPSTGFAATGTIRSSGTTVTGTGTQFSTQILAGVNGGLGDTVRVFGRPGTGTITCSGRTIVGTGTVFTQQMREADYFSVGGSNYPVKWVVSDTEAITGGLNTCSFTDQSFTINQTRRVVATSSATSAVIDAPFKPNLTTDTTFSYEQCQTGGARYSASVDAIGAWMRALQDYGIWHWQIGAEVFGTGPNNAGAWGNADYVPRCSLTSAADHAYFVTTFKPYGTTDGYLGIYVADEPSYYGGEGIENSFEMQRGQARAGMGGLNFWVDGASPMFAFDQWNNIVDSIGPDPYPATGDALGNTDDAAYGITSWNKHGRSWSWPRRSAESVFDSRPVITTIQLFRWFASQSYSTYPQVSDMKIQAVSALAAGNTGILWWHMASGFGTLGDRDEAAYVAFRKAGKYIQQLLPILEQPLQDLSGREDGVPDYGRLIASVSDSRIRCSSRQRGDEVMLACANTTNTDISATITLSSPVAGKVHVPWDNSVITPTGSSFTYTFRGLNGGTLTSGTGNIANASGSTVTCTTTCAFLSQLTGGEYSFPTITANGETRLVINVQSNSQLTIEGTAGGAWNGATFTYSLDQDKAKAAEIFLLSLPAAATSRPASN